MIMMNSAPSSLESKAGDVRMRAHPQHVAGPSGTHPPPEWLSKACYLLITGDILSTHHLTVVSGTAVYSQVFKQEVLYYFLLSFIKLQKS